MVSLNNKKVKSIKDSFNSYLNKNVEEKLYYHIPRK
jgi:hypothetical protein